MASPVVASVAESNTTTAGTSHVVTLPSGIAAGDLLIVILDKGSTSATVNALTGWTELLDEALANGLYIAYRWADGTEGASITLTTSASTRTARIAYRITGAINPATQPPQIAGTTASGTSATPDPPSITPTGGSKDYLFIAFAGMAGEEADDDTWGNTPPTNYTPSPPRQIACGVAGTNLGGLILSAERQLTASTDDPGTFGVDVSAAWRAQTIAVHPVVPTQTGVARISLASGSTPATRTLHSIGVRARVTSGAGTIRAALYEGATNRSGDLESSALTTSLADYTLSIADVDAANITDYSNLEIRFWGYSVGGGSIVFEVDQVYLTVPAAPATTPISGSDSNGTVTETASVKISATDVNSTVTEAIVLAAQSSSSDVNGTSTEVLSLRLAATDNNGADTEIAGIKLSSSDVNGAVTENSNLSASISSSDVNGSPTELISLRLAVADANSVTTENGVVTVPVSSSDSNGATTESGTPRAVLSDVEQNSTTTEITKINQTTSDTNGSTTENGVISVPVSTSDQNGVTVEITAIKLTVSDANGAMSDNATFVAAISGSDVNGATTEATTLRILTTDVNGVTTEAFIEIVALASADFNGATGESGSTGTNTPVSSSDSNGATTEITSVIANLSASDANGSTTESGVLKATPSSTDFNGVTTEIISAFRIIVTDTNGAVIESGSNTTMTGISTDSGQGSESVSLAVNPQVADSGAGADSAALVASYVVTEGVSTAEFAQVSLIALTDTDDGVGIETWFVLRPGIISSNPPRMLYGASEDIPVLVGASEDIAELDSTVIQKPVLGGANGRG